MFALCLHFAQQETLSKNALSRLWMVTSLYIQYCEYGNENWKISPVANRSTRLTFDKKNYISSHISFVGTIVSILSCQK